MATALAIRRVTKEVKAITESEDLKSQGVYYIPDEKNLMHGTALLVGPKDTPYEGGFYFFDVKFPDDYPYSPPKLLSLTQDGSTRFNPNLYVCGKVCLSILNTWQGPGWNVAQTLQTVLLSVLTAVLNDYPIANEPGYEGLVKTDKCDIYNRLIFHANVKTAIIEMISNPLEKFIPFKDIMKKEFEKHMSNLLTRLEELTAFDGSTETSVYSMTIRYNFGSLKDKIELLLI
jgi:ubiquitin-conjugating enzyme E2 Z